MGVAQALESQMGVLMEDNGKERSMCATLAEVRTCLAEVPEHMRWALNEVRLLLCNNITGSDANCLSHFNMLWTQKASCRAEAVDTDFEFEARD